MDYLDFLDTPLRDQIIRVRNERQAWVNQNKKGFMRYRKPYESVCRLRASWCDFSGDSIKIGKPEDISADEYKRVNDVLHNYMPWRKGPFSIFGIEVDSEWRSERKWNRIVPELPDLSGKIIADIGCNNGYYMFRMAYHKPLFVLGFEPYAQHHYVFKTLNSFAGQKNLLSEPLGVEHINLFADCFDVVFLLGIIYHRPSPIETLRDIFSALKPGGTLIVESQAIPGEEPIALFPERTYAKVPGTWFVPTSTCLCNWLVRSGFQDVKIFNNHPMSSKEQRRTDWMVYESYEDFIDKKLSDLTVEGYPSPWRVYIKAEKH